MLASIPEPSSVVTVPEMVPVSKPFVRPASSAIIASETLRTSLRAPT